jgi:hypothetical protein
MRSLTRKALAGLFANVTRFSSERKVLVASVAIVALAAISDMTAASVTPQSVKTCLAADGGHFEEGHELVPYPEEKTVLYRVVGHDSQGTVDVTI